MLADMTTVRTIPRLNTNTSTVNNTRGINQQSTNTSNSLNPNSSKPNSFAFSMPKGYLPSPTIQRFIQQS
jgi:hypothetical protein